MSRVVSFLAFNSAYYCARVADQGLSNVLGLQTFRHGTNPISWVSIHLFGADPSYGASKWGGDGGKDHLRDKNSNRFFAALGAYDGRFISQLYILRSAKNLASRITGIDREWCTPFGLLCSAIIPSIKIRYTDEEARRYFQRFPEYTMSGEFSTTQWVSPFRIGLLGTIWSSLTPKTFENIFRDPIRLIAGIAQLAFAALMLSCMLAFFKNHRAAAISGAVLAVL